VTKRKRVKKADFVVGYGRPPKESQFTPGKSGNPRGRPRGTRPVGAVLRDIIHQKVSVTEGDKARRVPVLEVMLRRLANDAMRGDQKAIKLLLLLVDRYGESPETALQLSELLIEDEAILAQYLHTPREAVPDNSASPARKEDTDEKP
jgi:hypothetical protein